MKKIVSCSKRKNKAFTLIELVVVIAIIAVLVALIAPNLMGYLGQANDTKGKAAAKSVYTAVVARNADPAKSPITTSNGIVEVSLASAEIEDYFNQEEIKDIGLDADDTEKKIVAYVNNGTVEAIKIKFKIKKGTFENFYYPEGTDDLFSASP